MSRLRLPRVHRSAARRLADLPLGDSPICCSTTAPRQARPKEGKGEKWDARSAGSQAPHDWDRLPLPLPKSYMPRAPCFTRHGGRAWGSPGERNRPSEITDLDTHMHRPSAQGGLACIAQAPKRPSWARRPPSGAREQRTERKAALVEYTAAVSSTRIQTRGDLYY